MHAAFVNEVLPDDGFPTMPTLNPIANISQLDGLLHHLREINFSNRSMRREGEHNVLRQESTQSKLPEYLQVSGERDPSEIPDEQFGAWPFVKFSRLAIARFWVQ
jgi:hypothetical protein